MLVDLGGAEMNAEMAIELLEDGRGERVRVCDAPIVEGAVIAAVEASGGADARGGAARPPRSSSP